MKQWKILILMMLFCVCGCSLQAQKDSIALSKSVSDSVKVAKHNPTTAMLLSVIPGGGQIYNKKYWKLPIVYGALAASGYFVYSSAKSMMSFRDEFINRRDGNTSALVADYAIYNDENILQLKNDYRRNMEIAIGVTAILYVLNIVDAMVDAHLYYFDISDDLSLRLMPVATPNLASNNLNLGLNVQLKW